MTSLLFKNNLRTTDALWYLSFVHTKAVFNMRAEVRRNRLSYAWWILDPVLHTLVFYIVFGVLLKGGGDDFPSFLMCGLIPWMWTSKSIESCSNSILTAQHLMLYVKLPPLIFPVIILLETLLKQIPMFFILICFLLIQGYYPSWMWLSLLPLLTIHFLMICSVGFLVSLIIPFARDISYLVGTTLTFIMFLSGIFFDYTQFSGKLSYIFVANPIAFILKSYRDILMFQTHPDYFNLSVIGLAFTILILTLVLISNTVRNSLVKAVTS